MQLTVMKNVTSSLMRMVEKLESSNVVDSLIMQKILILERKVCGATFSFDNYCNSSGGEFLFSAIN